MTSTPSRASMDDSSSGSIHIDAWLRGRRFTHDGSIECLSEIAVMAGARPGDQIATDLDGLRVFDVTDGGLIENPVADFETARRGRPPITAADAIEHLDECFVPFVTDGHVEIIDFLHQTAPADLAAQFTKHRARSAKSAACCYRDDDDGSVHIILDVADIDPSILRHEMIHVAQCLLPEEASRMTLSLVAGEGRGLLDALRTDRDGRRCVDWLESACASLANDAADASGTFDMALLLYPPRETEALWREHGFGDAQGAAAALFAAAAEDAGIAIEPLSVTGREIVAYRMQSGLADSFEPMHSAIPGLAMETPAQMYRYGV